MASERTLALAVVLAAPFLGCASDATVEPEPTIETPGAFIAVDDGEDSLRLFRTLDLFVVEDVRILFVTRYHARPRSYGEAREVAKDHNLGVAIPFEYLGVGDLDDLPHQVVWFRTLTEEERDRIP